MVELAVSSSLAKWSEKGIKFVGLSDATQYDALGVDEALACQLKKRQVNVELASRLHKQKVPWSLVRDVMLTSGFKTRADTSGLVSLWRSGLTSEEILEWSRLGSLEQATRLYGRNMSASTASRFPLGEEGLAGLVKMAHQAHQHAILPDDLLLWFTGNVLSTPAPYINMPLFSSWRSLAVHKIGMHRAAVACGAGLTSREAVKLVQSGKYDEEALLMLVTLRAGPGGVF